MFLKGFTGLYVVLTVVFRVWGPLDPKKPSLPDRP